jgi:hypothetical protein
VSFGGLLMVSIGLAQEPAPPTAAAPAPTEVLAPVPKYEYQGKPIVLPFACTEDQLQQAGLSCPESEPCPVFLELAGLESWAGHLVLVGNLHSSAATFSSVLLLSDDNGKTWLEPHERIPQAVLEGAQFADADSGWAGGQILTTLPRDPFFLVTSNGGKAWKRRPIYDDTRVAAIDSFYFESAKDGMLVVDLSRSGEPNQRSQMFETRTGGDSWITREVSNKPLPLKKTRQAPANLRLRADGPTKAYRVEQLQAGKWTPLAAFAVRLPDCQIGMKELQPPPEPEPTPEPVKPSGPKTPPSLKKKQ